MKVLVAVPRMQLEESANYNYMFPLGLAYISAVLKKAGHQVACLNLNHCSGDTAAIVKKFVEEQGPFDAASTGGISTIYRQIKSLVEALKTAQPGIKLILGGGLISSEPELMFSELKPDYLVLGEGEETIRELLACLAAQGDVSQVAGIGYSGPDGKLIFSPARSPIKDIDALPWPDFEGFGFAGYLDKMRPSDQFFQDLFDQPRVYPIICSRSCPFLCTFCYHPIGQKYRQRSVKAIIEELAAMISRYRINLIAIYDELFSNDRGWLIEFCREIKALLKEIPWECRWGCQMRVDKLDDEMLQMMKEAGCYSVSYGFESYSPAVLKSMKKHIIPEQIDRAIELTQKNNLSLQANFIFGDPAETLETAKTTLAYWRANLQAGIMLTFVSPYPGTEIYQQALASGLIKDRLDFIENRIFGLMNLTKTLNARQFARLWFEVNRAVIKYRIYARRWALRPEKGGTYAISVECPHCRETIKYRNYALKSRHYFSVMMYCRNCHRRFFLASGLFRKVFDLLLVVYGLVPGLSYRFYEHIWPKRYLLRQGFRKALELLKRPARPEMAVKNA